MQKGISVGFLDSIKNAANEVAAKEEARKKAEAALKDNARAVVISTGGLNQQYEIVDAIFAMDSHGTELFASADPATAFDGLKHKLRVKALSIGADAIIDCQFEYRVALGQGMFGGSKQCIELFAYGTAVRRPGFALPGSK